MTFYDLLIFRWAKRSLKDHSGKQEPFLENFLIKPAGWLIFKKSFKKSIFIWLSSIYMLSLRQCWWFSIKDT